MHQGNDLRPSGIAALLLLAVALFCTACDDHSAADVQAPPPPTPPAPQMPPPPTTQELLHGPRSTISLGIWPLAVRVPQSWQTQSGGRVALLQGPGVQGDIQIQLNERSSMTGEQIELLVAGARKEMEENPQSVKMAELRQAGTLRIFQRQTVGSPLPPVDEQGRPIPDPSPTLRWTIDIFVPQGASYATYELHFVELSLNQYEANKELLQEIVNSIQPAGRNAEAP